jgi:TetR/AcrR family transcriptional regulator, lmrAB and yxaGH operons repressor
MKRLKTQRGRIRAMPTPATAKDTVPAPRGLDTADTRERILLSAMRLFRKHGYHGVGLAEILAMAQAPKGSLYHHFPGGKEAIGVAVVQRLGEMVVGLMRASRARSAATVIADVADQLAQTMARTGHELCTLFSGFAAERSQSPQLGLAVREAYASMAQALVERLRADGLSPKAADELAQLVLILLEGGAMLAQAQQSAAPFVLAAKHAVAQCKQAVAGQI